MILSPPTQSTYTQTTPLISDFYKGYDSLDCIHQKCLIHLMRDVSFLNFLLSKEKDIEYYRKNYNKNGIREIRKAKNQNIADLVQIQR
jgi:hypothetical protein